MTSDEWFKYNVNTSPLEQEARAQEVVPEVVKINKIHLHLQKQRVFTILFHCLV